MQNPFKPEESIQKDSLGIIVVFFDMITVVAIILFTKILTANQNNFVDIFDQATLEMSDFTIRVGNLPH